MHVYIYISSPPGSRPYDELSMTFTPSEGIIFARLLLRSVRRWYRNRHVRTFHDPFPVNVQ